MNFNTLNLEINRNGSNLPTENIEERLSIENKANFNFKRYSEPEYIEEPILLSTNDSQPMEIQIDLQVQGDNQKYALNISSTEKSAPMEMMENSDQKELIKEDNGLNNNITSIINSQMTDKDNNQEIHSPESTTTKVNKLGRKKSYTKEEDDKILALVETFGEDWSVIANYFPGRDRKQIRDHYINYLNKDLNKREFTHEEDLQIIEMKEVKKMSWVIIADSMPGRSQIMIKNRYNSKLAKRNLRRYK
jgi:hypothetical protein